MGEIRREMKISKRLLPQLAKYAIKGNIIRALVELITNSDDSYRTLAAAGTPKGGKIKITIIRKNKQPSIIKIVDEAAGFVSEEMDVKIGVYAEDTSGLTKGIDVRGYFGRGLKDSMIAVGKGEVKSLKGREFNYCQLSEKEYVRQDPPKMLSKSERRELSKVLDIHSNEGTEVSLVVSNNKIKIPRFDNLSQGLESYFSLRDIMSSNKRQVIICEMDDKGRVKIGPQRLAYKEPIGELLLGNL